MASLTVVQYTPNMPNSTTKLPAKPWWTYPEGEATKTQQTAGLASNSGRQMELAGKSNDMAQLVSCARSDASGAQGMHLKLTLCYSQPDS
jgi:hypothetical protein